MKDQSRCREKIEGSTGRRRTYTCIECHLKFQEDRLSPLLEFDRICSICRINTHFYTFTNKRTGKDTQVRASNVELATLRAQAISHNLTFKLPQPTQGYGG